VTPDELAEHVRRGVARLRQLDRRCQVSGATHHRHHFGPPVSPQVLAAHEARHGYQVPPDLRAVCVVAGNGGAGPFQGLVPLDLTPTPPAGLSRPFRPPGPPGDGPYRRAAPGAADDAGVDAALDGTLRLCLQGSGLELRLVLNGPAVDQVWWWQQDGTGAGAVLEPVTDAEGQPLHFAEWYTAWLDGQLALHERLVALMDARTPHTELPAAIQAALGGPLPPALIDRTLLSLLDRPASDDAERSYARWLARRVV
jgi:hypothetical protein